MGKKDVEKNIPTNASLSWTLNHLTTTAQLTMNTDGVDRWEPLPSDYPFQMSATGREKFLNHFLRIKDSFGVTDGFTIASGNNFPADCGIASSASSFAALTEVSCRAFAELSGKSVDVKTKANLSARGSGSSCRSFFNGLVQWSDDGVALMESELGSLSHMVVIVGGGSKKVSSSEAHKRVASSRLFQGRVQRCEARLQDVINFTKPLDWPRLFETVWAEFWDMHALFETSTPSFGYFSPGTIEVLNGVSEFWAKHGDGPVVTMDAGPNIHLLWREDQNDLSLQYYTEALQGRWTCLSNIEGIGFAKI